MVPQGTSITVRLQDPLSSRYSVPGQRFDAVLDEPIVVDNQVVVPAGSVVTGHVTSARRSGRLRHPGELGLTLELHETSTLEEVFKTMARVPEIVIGRLVYFPFMRCD